LNPKTNSRMTQDARPDGKAAAPVKAHVYRSIAELNGGFEMVVRELQTLAGNGLFRLSGLTAMRETICQMRAQANREFARAIHDRESVNAGHSSAAP
jgi:hypothetical protein